MPYKEEETETVLPFRGGFRRGSWNARQRFGTVLEWGGKISEPPKIPGFNNALFDIFPNKNHAKLRWKNTVRKIFYRASAQLSPVRHSTFFPCMNRRSSKIREKNA